MTRNDQPAPAAPIADQPQHRMPTALAMAAAHLREKFIIER
jgi:hypothetical protein